MGEGLEVRGGGIYGKFTCFSSKKLALLDFV
jgi:hypothetical protein